MSDESIEGYSHAEWLAEQKRMWEERAPLRAAIAREAAISVSVSYEAGDKAAPRSPREWASQVQEEFFKSEGGKLLQKIAEASRGSPPPADHLGISDKQLNARWSLANLLP